MNSEFVFWGKNREEFTAGGVYPGCSFCSLPAEQHPNPSCDKTEARVLREILFDTATVTYSIQEYLRRVDDARDWRKVGADKNLEFVGTLLSRIQRRLIGLSEPTAVVDKIS